MWLKKCNRQKLVIRSDFSPTYCAQTFFSLVSLAMQVDPITAVGLGATVVAEDGLTVVVVALVVVGAAVVDGFTEVEIGATGNFQIFSL
jgi:hypothetical protein